MGKIFFAIVRPVFLLLGIIILSCAGSSTAGKDDIIIENEQVRLTISGDGTAKSLLFKPSQTECLIEGKKVPVSTLTQARPYQNEVKLAYPTKETTFKANSVRREGNRLIIGFELIPWEAVIDLKITPEYIGFTLEGFNLKVRDYGINMTEPPVTGMWFLRLPVRNLGHYGDWLNVIWNDKVAVNVLGTDHYAKIDSEEGDGYRILEAGVEDRVRLKGVGAALITCSKDKLLDNIGRIEENFNLPHGVNSRRHELYNSSYYWSGNVVPGNVDEHIKYAKLAGFRTFMIYYPSFIDSRGYRKLGNYDWRRPDYPNGKADLTAMLNKIKDAGMIPGFHFLHSHIGRDSKYITPVPDHRLNLLRIFTLSKPLGRNDTIIYVEQNPASSTMADNRRVLKIGTELISYKSYTTSRPYSFNGCVRGIDKTTLNTQPAGYMFGILDVSEFGATSVYIDQNSDLQEEIAQKLADIYSAGFQFVYFDGSEGVNPPFWFNVSAAQWKVYSQLKPEPLFAEGAAKTHFSWHMLSRGNAFDVFRPEVLKEEIRKHPANEAPRMENNLTRINFGWLGYWTPDKNSVGTQPDMLEYVTSRAAAWDCPVSIHADLKRFAEHARTPDNLEVLRRWEDVRAKHWLTDTQKQLLRNLTQEHILLLNENNEYELLPYDQIPEIAGGSREIRAFIFRRDNSLYVVYWHISGNAKISLPVNPKDITLMEKPGKVIQTASSDQSGNNTILPAGDRRYIMTGKLTRNELITAFKNARIIN
jgi:hypothetical protein